MRISLIIVSQPKCELVISMHTTSDLKATLDAKTRDDLHIVARRLGIQRYRRLKKAELISAILSTEDESRLARCLSVSWWDRHHNHVYGAATVLGVVLTILFFVVPYFTAEQKPATSQDATPRARTELGSINRHVADTSSAETADEHSKPSIVSIPEGFLPLTIEQLLAEVTNEQLTALQRNTLQNEYVGKTVQWLGTVRDVSPLSPGRILLLVSPASSNETFPKLISVSFSNDHRATLEKLGDGYTVEFQATIKTFDALSHLPRLDNGKIVRFSP